MKTIYCVYARIPEMLWYNKMIVLVKDYYSYEYDKENNVYVGFYGWTTNKNCLDYFIDFRKSAKKLYDVKKIKIEDEEYESVRTKYSELEIRIFLLSNGTKCADMSTHIGELDEYIIMQGIKSFKKNMDDTKLYLKAVESGEYQVIYATKYEYFNVVIDGECYMYEFIQSLINVNYHIFNSEFIDLLDMFGYCDEYKRLVGNEEDVENIDYNNGYNLTGYGNRKHIDFYTNHTMKFFYIYEEMIVGFDPNKGTRMVIRG